MLYFGSHIRLVTHSELLIRALLGLSPPHHAGISPEQGFLILPPNLGFVSNYRMSSYASTYFLPRHLTFNLQNNLAKEVLVSIPLLPFLSLNNFLKF